MTLTNRWATVLYRPEDPKIGLDIQDQPTLGVNFRAIDDLFELIEKRRDDKEYSVIVQMIEIYNENIFDLLAESSELRERKLDVRRNEEGRVGVNSRSIEVSNTRQVLQILAKGNRNRAVGSTMMNERSSRSHSLLTVKCVGKNLVNDEKWASCLHLVDLAGTYQPRRTSHCLDHNTDTPLTCMQNTGSERVARSEATGARLKEAQHINK